MENLLVFLELGMDLVRTYIGTKFLFGCGIRNKWAILLVLLLYGMGLISGAINQNINFIFSILTWIIIFIIGIEIPSEKKWTDKLYYAFVIVYQDELVCLVVKILFLPYYNRLNKDEVYIVNAFTSLGVMMIVCLVYCIVKKVKFGSRTMKVVKASIVPTLVFTMLTIMFFIVSVSVLVNPVLNYREYIIVCTICILSMISVGILFVVVSYVRATNQKMEQKLIMEQQLHQMELEHAEALLEKEELTRRYRHDEINHLSIVEELLQLGENEKARTYVSNMLGHILEIRDAQYDVGNKLVNVIMNHYITQLEEDVEICVKGYWDKEILATDYEISSIVSNLMKNAVEALQHCKLDDKKLRIEIDTGKMFLRLRIQNTFDKNSLYYDRYGKLQTSKKEKQQHGIGLSNVENLAKLHKGTFEYFVKEDQFCSEVCLRLR